MQHQTLPKSKADVAGKLSKFAHQWAKISSYLGALAKRGMRFPRPNLHKLFRERKSGRKPFTRNDPLTNEFVNQLLEEKVIERLLCHGHLGCGCYALT